MKKILLSLSCIAFLFSCEKDYSFEAGPAAVLIVTTSATAITTSTATSGGEIISDGGLTITERGVCWSTSPGPTIALTTKTSDGTGTGAFTSSLTGLLPDTTYYVRAFANTASGTFYGDQRSFKTVTGPLNITVGMDYGGGKVGYVLQPGDAGYDPNVKHGLIVAKDSSAYSLNWSLQQFGTFVITNASDTAIGTGQSNTNKIVAVEGQGGMYAAKFCDDLILNGYNDWYLPSKNELWAIYQTGVLPVGPQYNNLWTSTESSLTSAYFICLRCTIPDIESGYKGNPCPFRPIRSF